MSAAMNAGDLLILCTDGLSSYVDKDIIEEILSQAPNANFAARELIRVALGVGGPDNVTVVVVKF